MAAKRELHVHPRLDRLQTAFLEAGPGRGEVAVVDVSERRAAPQGLCLSEQRQGSGRNSGATAPRSRRATVVGTLHAYKPIGERMHTATRNWMALAVIATVLLVEALGVAAAAGSSGPRGLLSPDEHAAVVKAAVEGGLTGLSPAGMYPARDNDTAPMGLGA